MAGKITYIAPVQDASGKIFGKKNKWTAVTRKGSKNPNGCTFGGERNYNTHPLSNDEINRRAKFKAVALKVAARRKTSSPTYEADLAAFFAQRDMPGGYPTIQKWLWADELSKVGA